MEFFVRHHQVLRPIPGGLNPYHLGYHVFADIHKRWEDPDDDARKEYGRPGGEGDKKIFQVRESERDVSFLRAYLTENLARDLDLFVHEEKGRDRVISEVADPEGFERVKAELLRSVGSGRLPVIKILDADLGGNRALVLKHYYDGRELDAEYAEKTVRYLGDLWGGTVTLQTVLLGQDVTLVCKDGEVSRG
jgi:stage V sporulation protein R